MTRFVSPTGLLVPLLAGALTAAGPALAQPAPKLPAAVTKSMEDSRKDCAPQKAVFKTGFMSSKDVNGDGVADYILDYGNFACGDMASLYCGSAGCSTEVIVSMPGGGFNQVFSDNVRGMSFKAVGGKPAMLLDLHGSACGRSGAEACRKTLYWDGSRFAAKR